MGRLIVALAQIKAVVPYCIRNPWILHCHILVEKSLVLLKNESVKVINFIKSCPLSSCFIITLFNNVVNTHKALLHSEVLRLSQWIALLQLFELGAKQAIPLPHTHRTQFLLGKQWLVDKLYSCSDFDIWQKFSQKWTNRILSLAMTKISSKNKNVENLPILTEFSDDIDSIWNVLILGRST